MATPKKTVETDTNTTEAPAGVAPATPPATPATAPVAALDTRSYLVMMLLAIFMLPSGLARAYRGEQIGWIRFWIFAGSYLTLLVPPLGLLGVLALVVLSVWGLIDVFLLRTITTDAAGRPLASTPTDKKWAKGFFIYLLVSIVLVTLLAVAAVSFGAWAMIQCRANPASCRTTSPFDRYHGEDLPMQYGPGLPNESF